MKITINDTNLFDKELDKKICKELKNKILEFDKSKKYRMDLEFCEDLIRCEYEIDSYDIPEEALPPYQRGKKLKGEEKMYELLHYRVDSVKNIVKGYGIELGSCNIKGTPSMELNKIELMLEEEEDAQLDNSCKRKKEKKITVNMIMPSLSGFVQNLIKVSEDFENKIETELMNVFDDKKEYDKYKSLLDKFELYNILNDFKKEYGDMWIHSEEYKSKLKKKYIETIEIKAGIISDDKLKESILQPLEFRTTLIYEIPICKMNKKNSRIHKHIGHIRLLTNGRIINVKYLPLRKPYCIAEECFNECFISVTPQDNNKKILKKIEEIVNRVDEICQRLGYILEKDAIHNVVAYMDIKSIVKKAREA